MLEIAGAQRRIRTTDTRIFNPLLYQLSYLGAGPACGLAGARPAPDTGLPGKRAVYSMGFAPVQRRAREIARGCDKAPEPAPSRLLPGAFRCWR